MIGVVSYGMGNIRSVCNALEHLGHEPLVASAPDDLDKVDRIILPGVGAFPAAMERLGTTGFADALNTQVRARGKPVLGICLGMQLLGEIGTEFGDCAGLGWIPGRVEIIPRGESNLRLPQIGWNELEVREGAQLFTNIEGDSSCYFVHSYQLLTTDPSDVVATVDYGGPVTAAVERDNIFGAQFHPEKSARVGLAVLDNFANI
ncbi:MAG: imidazole glycerol phosphate synthase subunit HisH [Rhodospirillaceae bacterium]|jgi:imidazole glycerol-phosphate synthase subunit HisH|nr:imidazole glycerol phosphate synthase subunit HisH [Rhodospirillaceae bacterium]